MNNQTTIEHEEENDTDIDVKLPPEESTMTPDEVEEIN